MKVLTESGLMGFARAIAENHRPTEQTVQDLFDYYSEEMVLGWSAKDTVSINAFDFTDFEIEGINEADFTPQAVDFIKDYLISGKSEFSPERILSIFSIFEEDADCGNGVSWDNLRDAVYEEYSCDELIAFIQEAYAAYIDNTEAKNNDDNIE